MALTLEEQKNTENAEFQEVQRTRGGFYDEHFLKGELARLGCQGDNMKSLHTITNCSRTRVTDLYGIFSFQKAGSESWTEYIAENEVRC